MLKIFGIFKIPKIPKNYLRYIDYVLLINVILTIIFGIIMIYSATYSYPNSSKYIITQILSAIIGFILIFFITLVDYRYFGQAYKIIYILNILILASVFLLGTGKAQWGGQRWIRIGGFGIQPSEVAKIGFIISLAKYLDIIKEKINEIKYLAYLLAYVMVPVILVMMQPDLGTALSFFFIFVVMVYMCNINYKYIISAFLAAIVALPIAWNFLLKPYQKARILVFLNPGSDPLNSGYHVIQSQTAIGSGGLSGNGLFSGFQTQLDYLPEKHTDFIFSVIGEEMGFLGCIVVILLLLLIIYRCIIIAKNTRDTFGSFICIGVASMLLFQTTQNIGMCIGLAPVTGIPLPFISYGGSSLITNLVGIGLVLAVDFRRKYVFF